MKLYMLSSFIALFVLVQPTKPEIVGKWLYEGEVNKKNKIDCCEECPELIEFKSNGSYTVLNDCYGDDPRKPVVETGKWEFMKSQKKLVLKDRKLLTNPYLFSQKKIIELEVVSVESNKLKLRYNQGSTVQYNREK